jgi:hypothetical protein
MPADGSRAMPVERPLRDGGRDIRVAVTVTTDP